MLSFRKITFAVFFLISACGCSPLSTNNNFASLIGKIDLQEPNSQNDFVFYSQLKNRFSEVNSKYILNYAITIAKEDKAINFDGTVHRVEISGFVTFSLKDIANGVQIFSDKEDMYLSYSKLGSTTAVLNAERTTNKQLMVLLADKVADRISLILVDQDT